MLNTGNHQITAVEKLNETAFYVVLTLIVIEPVKRKFVFGVSDQV